MRHNDTHTSHNLSLFMQFVRCSIACGVPSAFWSKHHSEGLGSSGGAISLHPSWVLWGGQRGSPNMAQQHGQPGHQRFVAD